MSTGLNPPAAPADLTGSTSSSGLVAVLRARLSAEAGPAAELERKLRARLAALQAASDADPFRNPLLLLSLELSRLIDQAEVRPDTLEALVQRLTVGAFADRAEHVAAYLEDVSVEANEAALTAVVRELAGDPPVPFAQFRARVERPSLGIVLTAHPTFSLPKALAEDLIALATGLDPTGEPLDDAAAGRLIDRVIAAEHLPPATLTLQVEHAWSMSALAHLQDALDRVAGIVYAVAAELYPEEWEGLTPCLATAASWVGYDLDGRSDIAWSDTVAKRLEVKLAQLRRNRGRVAALAEREAAAGDALAPVTRSLDAAIDAVTQQLAAIDAVAKDPGEVGRVATAFIATRATGLVDTKALRADVAKAASVADAPALQQDLAVLRTGLAWHGLGLAHTHVRLNATQLHNAIRKQVGMDSAPDDPTHRRSYMSAINELLGRVKPETVNFATLMVERATARRLFMIVQQVVKYVDAETPVRFLIAETEAGFTLLTALYFARLFGVEESVEISPLFETAAAIERGDAILDDALRSPHYLAYVKRLGRLTVQFGFSDSGRYLGQMAATFMLERLRLRLVSVMERHGLSNVQLVLFNTHGESIGRGGHPTSLFDRYRYASPPVTRAVFAQHRIALKDEISFQGGDGFMLFAGLPTALSVLRAGLEAYLRPDPEALNDPVYAEGDYAVEFFAAIRQSFEALVDDPNYAAMLGVFGSNLQPRTGSRPMKRQHDGALRAMDVAHVSQLRAIPNNTILQQLAFMANTIHGVGAARSRDPELFDHLLKTSPRFRRAMGMVQRALACSDLDVFRAYLDGFDPGLWLARSGRARSGARRAELRKLAQQLEKLELHPPLAKVFRRLQADVLLMMDQLHGTEGLQASTPHMLLLLHMVRLVLIHRIYLLAVHIPEFSAHHGLSHEDVVARLIRLDVPATVATLKELFPKTDAASVPPEALAEPSTYRSDATQSYAREHLVLFDPLLAYHRMIQLLGSAISAEIGAVG